MDRVKKAIPAKICYEHIGGKLGQLLLEQFIIKGWLKKESAAEKNYIITKEGEKYFTELGLDLEEIKS